jgi:hypothetical protein
MTGQNFKIISEEVALRDNKGLTFPLLPGFQNGVCHFVAARKLTKLHKKNLNYLDQVRLGQLFSSVKHELCSWTTLNKILRLG